MNNQRWQHRRDSWRPAGEVIDTTRYGVELIPDDTTARAFVETHHYSASYPAARVRVGLYRMRELVGVAVFSVPCNNRVIPSYLEGVAPDEGVELGRFVLLDDVPGNGETWFLSRAFKLLKAAKPELRAVLSYSDPVPRRTDEGITVMPGHVGTIYQAHNGVYAGRSSARTLLLDRHGRVLSPRTLSKIRQQERGLDYALAQLDAATGCTRRRHEPLSDYLTRATAHLRRVRHPGNHAYLWSLERRLKLTADRAVYPKQVEPAYAERDGQALLI